MLPLGLNSRNLIPTRSSFVLFLKTNTTTRTTPRSRAFERLGTEGVTRSKGFRCIRILMRFWKFRRFRVVLVFLGTTGLGFRHIKCRQFEKK
jgi:hypothetical protein